MANGQSLFGCGKRGPEDNKSQDMSTQNPHRHALYSHLYLYINLIEWHTGRLWRRHLMPCQNITPVTVLPNFDRLPCQGMERFMSPICLDCWQVAESGGLASEWMHRAALTHSHPHVHWPIYLLFVHSHNARHMWILTFCALSICLPAKSVTKLRL